MKETPRNKFDRNAVIVLGMHRSGTSLLTGILHLIGANLGSTLIPPAEDNPKGFWENQMIVEFHDRLLLKLQRQWDAVLPLPERWWESSEIASDVAELEELLESEFKGEEIWALKDPRICVLLPLWMSLLERKNINAHFVIIHRHPEEVCQSLFRRNSFPKSKSHLLYLHHYLSAEFRTRNSSRTFISYNNLLEDWRKSIRTFLSVTGLSWNESSGRVEKEIDAFVDKGIRHYSFRNTPIKNDLEKVTSLVHKALMRLNGRVSVKAMGELDNIRSELEVSESLLNSWLIEIDLKSLEIAKYENVRLETSSQQVGLQREIEFLTQLKNEHERELGERDSKVLETAEKYKTQLDQINAHRMELKQELSSISERAGEQQKEIKLLTQLKFEHERELGERDSKVLETAEKYKTQLDQINAHQIELKQELSSISERAGEQQKEIKLLTQLKIQQQEELSSISERAGEQQKEIKLLTQLKIQQQEELVEMDAHQRELKGELDSTLLRIDNQQKEIFAISAALESVQFEAESLMITHEDLLKESDALQKSNLAQDQKINEQKELVFVQKSELKLSNRNLNLKNAEILRLNANLDELLNSTSWKLTQPIRTFKIFAKLLLSTIALVGQTMTSRSLANTILVRFPRVIRKIGWLGLLKRFPDYIEYARRLRQSDKIKEVDNMNSSDQSRYYLIPEDEPKSLNVTVSVVIPTFNAGHEFYWLLRKLKAQKGIKDVEVVIVDSASTDDTAKLASIFDCNLVQISQEEFSHSFSRNLGAKSASGDYLLFMVQDAYPIGDYWLHGILSYLFDHKSEGVVAASCSEYCRLDSDITYDCNVDTHYKFLMCREVDRIGMFTGEDHMSLRAQGQLSDVSCLIPRKLFLEYRYRGNYAEDLDLGIRLIRDDNKVAMLASIKTIHSHNRPAYYYFKRSFVDVIFLVKQFDDFDLPHMQSFEGLFLGIVASARCLSEFIDSFSTEYSDFEIGHVLEIGEQQLATGVSEWNFLGEINLLDDKLNEKIGEYRADYLKDRNSFSGEEVSEAQAFFDGFLGRIRHFRSYAESIYVEQDNSLREELIGMYTKNYASSVGSYLGFMYLKKHLLDQHAQDSLEKIRLDLQAGI
jgi:glycosyltransferase involved in cell wall biosynthesis